MEGECMITASILFHQGVATMFTIPIEGLLEPVLKVRVALEELVRALEEVGISFMIIKDSVLVCGNYVDAMRVGILMALLQHLRKSEERKLAIKLVKYMSVMEATVWWSYLCRLYKEERLEGVERVVKAFAILYGIEEG
uniref:Uncharacterized protein n=1 Tax=Ignisphaera aggregans TaxID=334771 RepID=A0A7J3ZAN8_9CREN